MALRAGGPLFSQEWVDRLSPSVERSMTVDVEFYRPDVAGAQWGSSGWEVNETSLYSGKARVQPLRGTSSVNQNANDTTVQTVLMSIPVRFSPDLDLRTNDRARVVSAPLNPSLENYVYVMQEIVDSGNIIERTVMFRVNQEQVETDG